MFGVNAALGLPPRGVGRSGVAYATSDTGRCTSAERSCSRSPEIQRSASNVWNAETRGRARRRVLGVAGASAHEWRSRGPNMLGSRGQSRWVEGGDESDPACSSAERGSGDDPGA